MHTRPSHPPSLPPYLLRHSKLLERPQVDDELMGALAVAPPIENGEVRLQSLGHVVSIQNRDLGGLGREGGRVGGREGGV